VSEALAIYLDLLFGAEPAGSFAELRWRLRDGRMGREFVGLGDRRRLAAMIGALGAKTDCYVGVCPRVRQEGGRDAVERCHAVWVDLDDEAAIEALEHFSPAPSMVVRSGSGRHAYWALWPPLAPAWAEKANQRLALALGGDARSCDAARILRPPSTTNWKTGEPRPVENEHVDCNAVYEARAIVGELPDPPAPRRRERPPAARPASDDPLLAIPPPVYVEALTGREVGRDSKVRCPFHDDHTPSLHAFDDLERGWTCFGCDRGGTIIDFGAALWEISPRGAGYHELRRRLAGALLGREAAA